MIEKYKSLEFLKSFNFFKSLKSLKTLKLPKTLRFFVAITPLVFLFGGCWGYGWFVPFAVQPSYYKFKKMCGLNELPNNEEKYNKILAYVDLSLDSLDWERLEREALKLDKNYGNYVKDLMEYRVMVAAKENWKYRYSVWIYTNKNGVSRENISTMELAATWNSGRKILEFGNEGNMQFNADEWTLWCELGHNVK